MCPSLEELSDFALDSVLGYCPTVGLSRARKILIGDHILSCTECQMYVQDTQESYRGFLAGELDDAVSVEAAADKDSSVERITQWILDF